MLLPNGFNVFCDYFEEVVVFLHKYTWLYEVPVTHVLTHDIFSKIPQEWITCLLEISSNELNQLPKGLIKDSFPQSLVEFCQDCQRLTLPVLTPNVPIYKPYSLDEWLRTVPREIWRGMNPKKKAEVESMLAFVHHESKLLGISKIVDLGSGLGYIDRLLLLRGYRILGIESQVKLVKFATVQKDNFFPPSIARHLSYHGMKISGEMLAGVRSTILDELFSSKSDNVKCLRRDKSEHGNKYDWVKLIGLSQDMADDDSSQKVCMIGLHACGDLAVAGMELYLNIPEVGLLVLIPCCYHKMSLDSDNSNQTDTAETVDDAMSPADTESCGGERFVNFPLSEALKRSSVGARFVCRPFLRLASQGTNNSWQGWVEADHQRHAYNVLSRAVFQLFAQQERITIKKCFRRVVKKTSLKEEDFSSYINESINRCEFIKENQESVFQKNKEEIKKDLLEKWEQHKDKLKLVEVLTCLQMCLEPVAESLVVADRMCFLRENGAHDVRVVRMIDSCLSPRSLAYVVSKH